MEGLQDQINSLNHKVDGLYQIVEQLNGKIGQSLSESSSQSLRNGEMISNTASSRQYSHFRDGMNGMMEHKDVLVDSNAWDNSSEISSEKGLSPDIQIRRLTAQLTAAYHRIAALEEQLLARRIHS